MKKKSRSFETWLTTFTKRAVAIILTVTLTDLQLSYILAFIGKEQIAESLSSTIAETIIGVMIGYFMKSLLETFFENREKRLNKNKEGGNGNADLLSDPSASCNIDPDEFNG